MNLQKHRRDWNDLATLNPLFVSCHDARDPSFRGWDPASFLASGRREILGVVERLGREAPDVRHDAALDFGCGAGRLTGALSEHWSQVVGVDISEAMVARARSLHAANERCRFAALGAEDLSEYSDRSFDFVYSNEVLQHVASVDGIGRYIREFVRVLRPGGFALFQLPQRLSLAHRLKFRRHIYHWLRDLGLPAGLLYDRLKLQPTKLTQVDGSLVRRWLEPTAEIRSVSGENGYETMYLIRKTSAGQSGG